MYLAEFYETFEMLAGCPLTPEIIQYARRQAAKKAAGVPLCDAGAYLGLVTDYQTKIGCLPPLEVCEAFKTALAEGMTEVEIYLIICKVADRARKTTLAKGGELVIRAMRVAWRKGSRKAAP